MSIRERHIVFLDLETTSLDHDTAEILEIAVSVYRNKDDEILWRENIVMNTHPSVSTRMSQDVLDLHEQSSLLDDLVTVRNKVAQSRPDRREDSVFGALYQRMASFFGFQEGTPRDGYSTEHKVLIEDVEQHLIDNIKKLCPVPQYKLLMGGSGNSEYDRLLIRRMMPELESLFHYRSRDISMVRNFLLDYGMIRYGQGPFGDPPHRAIDDVDMFVEQERFLAKNLQVNGLVPNE